jgi:hypothetical protein
MRNAFEKLFYFLYSDLHNNSDSNFTMKDEIRIMLKKLSFILLYYRYVIY